MKAMQYKKHLIPLLFCTLFGVFTGCEKETDELNPSASFSVNGELKQGETVAFSSTSTEAVSYQWAFGDGTSAVGQRVTHVYEGPGDYMVVLEASGTGNRDVTSQMITIEGLIPNTGFSVENEADLKVAEPVQFQNSTVNGISYLWEFGDFAGSTSTEENPTFTYSNAGDYQVKLTATGTGGSSSFSLTVTVQPNLFELYFIDNTAGKVRKISLNDPGVVIDVFDLPGFCFGLAYDAPFDDLYYTDDDAGAVYRNSPDGSNQVEIATGISGGRDLEIDGDFLYLVERSLDQISVIDLVTNDKSVLYSVTDDPLFLLPVGIDVYDGNIYATAVDFDAETVWKGATDGSELSKIIDYSAGGYGYGIAVDKVNERIYFDDNDGGNILSANLDGTDVTTIGTATDRSYGIVIESESGKVYWAGRDGIIRGANLDGSNEEILVETGNDIRGMVIRQAE